jgi:hypothetical protein
MRTEVPQASRASGNAHPTGGIFAALALLGAATLTCAAVLARQPPTEEFASKALPRRRSRAVSVRSAAAADRRGAVRAARRLNRAAGTIATSVLIDSAMEHYRGAFDNKAMYTPILLSALTILASLHGHKDDSTGAHWARDTVYALAGLTGIIGTGFHFYNVGKRPGGLFRWQNLLYGAPMGAPAAISLAGMTGSLSERVRNNPAGSVPKVLGFPAGRVVAVLTGLGLLGTTGEAALLHFRGAFHNPAMFLPVTLPPGAAALLLAAATAPAPQPRALTRWWLRVTALLGVAGVGFHAIGVARNMGGWRNWRQNTQAGPPLPAPPAFSGLALAGLAALGLLKDNPDD